MVQCNNLICAMQLYWYIKVYVYTNIHYITVYTDLALGSVDQDVNNSDISSNNNLVKHSYLLVITI